jgi:transcriptional regulator with XRE-family HTH domain
MTNTIQNNIKKQLHAKNMTAAELERRTGIPHAVVNILHGRSKNPSLKTAQAIAKELGCSVEDLFSEQEDSVANNVASASVPWQPQIYHAVFTAVHANIVKLNLQPSATQVATWLTEVYAYTMGSPNQAIDARFVQWLLTRT